MRNRMKQGWSNIYTETYRENTFIFSTHGSHKN